MAKRSKNRSELEMGILHAAIGQLDGIELVRTNVIRGCKEPIPVKRPGQYAKRMQGKKTD
jgi:hypothetical protein